MKYTNILAKIKSCQTSLELIEKIYQNPGSNRRGLSEKNFSRGWDFYIVGRQGVYINHFYVGVPSIKNLKKSPVNPSVNKNPYTVNRGLEHCTLYS